MAKNKLKKFAEITKLNHVFEPSLDELKSGFKMKGNWKKNFFKNNNPIVLELGCGKGEYSVALAKKFPNKNFIGIDIKGARIWKGASDVLNENLDNVAFLRIRIEWIKECFECFECDEIWITFPDPQIKKRRETKRLTHPNFLDKYRAILKKHGIIHLKTDSEFLYGYTTGILSSKNYVIHDATNDLYSASHVREDLDIKTFYESKFLKDNSPITYLKFSLL